jgi:hypothetical protein
MTEDAKSWRGRRWAGAFLSAARVATLRKGASWLFGQQLRTSESIGILAILGAPFLLLMLVRGAVSFAFHQRPDLLPFLYVAGVVAACAFVRFRVAQIEGVPFLFLRGMALLSIIYVALEPFDFPIPERSTAAWIEPYLTGSRLVALACGVIAWWRPSFLLPALLYGAVNRSLMVAITQLPISGTDIGTVLEAGLIVSSIGFSVPIASTVLRARGEGRTAASWCQAGAQLVVAVAIGAHLGSYFHSGVAKLQLDGGALSWILDNQTQQGVLIALERGTQPFAAAPRLIQPLYDLINLDPVPANALVVILQLAAIAAMLHRRLLMALTLVYDAFHIGVYVIYGLMFWKWILLNLVIFGTLVRCRTPFTRAFILTGVAMTLFGHLVVWTARLAWYDSAFMLSTYVEAIDDQGRAVRVPSAAFGTLSYPFSHGLAYIPAGREGHFPALRWGSYFNHDAVVTSRRCEVPQGYDPTPNGFGSLENLRDIVGARHAQLLRRVNDAGQFNVYLHPHHHYPSPFVRVPFSTLDLRTVRRYRWIIESVCLSMENGQLQRRVIRTDSYDLGVPPQN